MKVIVLALALFCGIVCASTNVGRRPWPPRSTGPNIPRYQDSKYRFRREAEPQGSLVIHGTKPLSGPDRRPSLDVDYNQRLHDRNGLTAGTYGGLNIRPGQPPQPHAGINIQREYKNGFIGGFGQVERRPGGGASPTFGVNGGFRFRRDVDEVEGEEVEEQHDAVKEEAVEEQHRERREANPQGSLVIHGTKPLSGPDRRPSLDVDYNQRLHDRNGLTAGTYGGLNIRPGQPPQPHAGINIQREYKNGFIGGFGQVERRPGGGASPTFGVNGGFRFRRDVDEVEGEEVEEQHDAVEEEAVEEQHRERREANPQGSLVLHGTKPLSGPDRRPSLDVDYNQRLHDRNGLTAGTYGGLNIRPGQPPQPHAGINFQREYKNGFVGGFGQVQRRPGGGASPSFGINGGFRFRRDVDEVEGEEVEEQHRERREANPQGSLVLRGTKPLSGPDRRPSLDVDYNQRLHDRNGLTAGTYGGLNIRPGQPPQPHAGINFQREYKNGFVGGFGQVQRRPGGGASPSFGVNGGFRFRRDVDEVEGDEVEEQHRERREANPQGSLVLHGTKPLSGPDRRPSLDVDYNQRLHDRNGLTAGTYGGLNIRPGQPPQPHAGINFQREYKNGFVGGFGQVQRRPGGGASPSFGVNGGFRFRRSADEFAEEE